MDSTNMGVEISASSAVSLQPPQIESDPQPVQAAAASERNVIALLREYQRVQREIESAQQTIRNLEALFGSKE